MHIVDLPGRRMETFGDVGVSYMMIRHRRFWRFDIGHRGKVHIEDETANWWKGAKWEDDRREWAR